MMLEQCGEEYVEFANCLWYYGTKCFSGETIQIPARKDPKLRPGKGLEEGSGIGIHTERLGKATPKYVPFLAYGPPNSDSEAQSLAPLFFAGILTLSILDPVMR